MNLLVLKEKFKVLEFLCLELILKNEVNYSDEIISFCFELFRENLLKYHYDDYNVKEISFDIPYMDSEEVENFVYDLKNINTHFKDIINYFNNPIDKNVVVELINGNMKQVTLNLAAIINKLKYEKVRIDIDYMSEIIGRKVYVSKTFAMLLEENANYQDLEKKNRELNLITADKLDYFMNKINNYNKLLKEYISIKIDLIIENVIVTFSEYNEFKNKKEVEIDGIFLSIINSNNEIKHGEAYAYMNDVFKVIEAFLVENKIKINK